MDQLVAPTDRPSRLAGPIVALLAAAVALVGALPYAGSWNDGSRLATVETLVDQQALEIDRSMFVRGPGSDPAAPNPYTPGDEGLKANGTLDKLFIRDKDSVNGHYYSDKSPLPAVTMAGWYVVLKRTINLEARDDPGRFCYWMTVGSSGLGYVAAVWCVYQMGLVAGLPLSTRLLLTASLALASVAPAYTRHVNNHAMLLGVTAALVLSLARLAREIGERRTPWSRLLESGTLMGLGYSIDLGVGPPLVLATSALVAWRTRRLAAIVMFVLSAAPWIGAHHALNFYIGGTLAPANSVPAYFKWPNSPFTPENMTGGLKSIGHFLLYAPDLLVGKHGFLPFNLPMFLAVAGFFVLRRRRPAEWPELLYCAAFSMGTWLMYSVASVDHSGNCCSVRWFVPLLAPGYYVLAILQREQPAYRRDLLVLSGFGAVLAAVCWWHGPWYGKVPLGWGFWVIYPAALVAWGGCELARRKAGRNVVEAKEERPP
ncbi:MAG TPA: hypothetical protein VND64_18465 [Pirellulales bacterium]|nr:hypothetical protein [Pirellulales bacterium]